MDWYISIINIQCISSWKSRKEKSQSQRCKKIHNTNYVNGHPCNQLGKAASSWGIDQNNIRAWQSFLMNSSQLFDLQQVKLEEKKFGKVGLFLNSNSFRYDESSSLQSLHSSMNLPLLLKQESINAGDCSDNNTQGHRKHDQFCSEID